MFTFSSELWGTNVRVVCLSETCAMLKHVSDWHRAYNCGAYSCVNFVTLRADNNVSFQLIVFEVALHSFLKNKQTNKQAKKQMQ